MGQTIQRDAVRRLGKADCSIALISNANLRVSCLLTSAPMATTSVCGMMSVLKSFTQTASLSCMVPQELQSSEVALQTRTWIPRDGIGMKPHDAFRGTNLSSFAPVPSARFVPGLIVLCPGQCNKCKHPSPGGGASHREHVGVDLMLETTKPQDYNQTMTNP